MSQTPTAHAVSLQQTLKSVDTNIKSLGPGPYTPIQAEKLRELGQLKQRLVEQIKAVAPNKGATFPAEVMNAQNPAVGGSIPLPIMPTMIDTNSIKTDVPPIVLSQGGSAPQVHQSSANDDKILSKQRLQELVKEVDPNEQLDDDVEEMLMQITDDFIESVVGAACDITKHRNGTVLEVKDLKLHLENRWNISVPGYGSDEIKPFKKPLSTEAHKQRLSLIRKATKK